MLKTPKMKGLYRFEGNSNDGSGSGYNGTGTAITYAAGRLGKAASCDGSTSYVDFGNAADFNFGTGDFTIACHAYRDNTTGTHVLFAKGDPNLTSGYALIIQNAASGNAAALISNNLTIASSSSALSALQWYHVAVTRAGSTVQLYVNGAADGSSGTASYDFTNALTAVAGRWSHAASGYLAGDIDELIVWRKALSANDIRRVMLGMFPLGG